MNSELKMDEIEDSTKNKTLLLKIIREYVREGRQMKPNEQLHRIEWIPYYVDRKSLFSL